MCVGTINLIVTVNYGFTHEAMLEALAIGTESKVKAVYEAGLRSKANADFATGTGTDCVAIAAGPERRYRICGKHTKWGELIGRASLESIRGALRSEHPASSGEPAGNVHE
jgi:adenosylcobinamide amidohydrolase